MRDYPATDFLGHWLINIPSSALALEGISV